MGNNLCYYNTRYLSYSVSKSETSIKIHEILFQQNTRMCIFLLLKRHFLRPNLITQGVPKLSFGIPFSWLSSETQFLSHFGILCEVVSIWQTLCDIQLLFRYRQFTLGLFNFSQKCALFL